MFLRAILFAGAVHGFFQLLLLRSKNKNPLADKWLMSWLLLVSLQLLFYYDTLSETPFINDYFGIIAFSIPLLSAPVLFQYIRSVSFAQQVKRQQYYLIFLPTLIYLLFGFYIKFSYTNQVWIAFGYPHFTTAIPPIVTYLFTFPMAFIPGIYAVMGLFVLIRYKKSLPERYAYTEKITLNWLKWIVLSILILFILLFLFIRFGASTTLIRKENLFAYVGAILAAYVFLIGYFGMQQGTALIGRDKDDASQIKKNPALYQKSGLAESTAEEIYLLLNDYMKVQKPYLSDDLSLSSLAAQLALSANRLSQVINQCSGSNFFTFVNTYRVLAVKEKLIDPAYSHLSILGIAYECGFRSKSAFNRIFRTHTGISPIDYQKQNKI